MNVWFVMDGTLLSADIVMTWRPEHGDKVVIGGKLYFVTEDATYNLDLARWEIVLEPA